MRRALERLAKGARGRATLLRAGVAPELLQALAAEGLVEAAARETRRRGPRDHAGVATGLPDEGGGPPALTAEQAHACGEIAAAIRAREARPFLLHGVTGSGKTEVYLRAIAEALALGPPGARARARDRAHAAARRRGSARASATRSRSSTAASGPRERVARVAAAAPRRGARSPSARARRSSRRSPTSGVIVVDEEHDGSFKQEEGFRYHARDARACAAPARAGCPLVLGSATPGARDALRRASAARSQRLLARPTAIGGRPAARRSSSSTSRRSAPRAPRGRKLDPLAAARARARRDARRAASRRSSS